MENNIKYVTAPSYKDWEQIGTPIVKEGKMYTRIKQICDRCCHGVYVCRIENGQPVPHPAYGGVCLKCGGAGFVTKEVRLYTEAEAAKMEAANERARVKREAERRAKMEAEFEQKRLKWLSDNEFTKEGKTYVIIGDSYSIKDDLKEKGFRYNPVLKWHKADPGDYKDRVVEIDINDIAEASAWGEYHYLSTAQSFVAQKIAPEQEETTPSEWVGTIGDKLVTTVTFVRKGWCDTRFGGSNIYTFRDVDGAELVWFTSVLLDKEIGDTFKIKATVKAHNEYKGKKNTVISRAKIV